MQTRTISSHQCMSQHGYTIIITVYIYIYILGTRPKMSAHLDEDVEHDVEERDVVHPQHLDDNYIYIYVFNTNR